MNSMGVAATPRRRAVVNRACNLGQSASIPNSLTESSETAQAGPGLSCKRWSLR